MTRHCFILYCLLGLCLHSLEARSQAADTLLQRTVWLEKGYSSLSEWLQKMEQHSGVVFSYNSTQLEENERVRIPESIHLPLSEALTRIFAQYHLHTIVLPPNKVVLQFHPLKKVELGGSVLEQESGEKLYGAILRLEEINRQKTYYMVTSENGLFRSTIPEGEYRVQVSYMGYHTHTRHLRLRHDCFLPIRLQPQLYELGEVTVRSTPNTEQLSEVTPSNALSFNSKDLFSQVWILPGVIGGSPSGENLLINGGSDDENLMLLDGVPVYHPGHINSLLPVFNGDAVKSVSFYKGFFPTRLEGRLSSVTEFALKEGNQQEYNQILTWDMPAVSAFFEGPILKNKLSYAVGGRSSWINFFDELVSEEYRMNHSFYDYNVKLTYHPTPTTSFDFLAYRANDRYRFPLEENDPTTVLKWDNRIYQLRARSLWGKLENTSSVSYTRRADWVYAPALDLDMAQGIENKIRTLNVSTEFKYTADPLYTARWGVRFSSEDYELPTWKEKVEAHREPVSQYSVFYDNLLHLAPRLGIQVGIHWVSYVPKHHQSYHSIQPRISVKYTLGEKDLLYAEISKMEQFYHTLRMDNTTALPTDFRMPSIAGYKPRSSEHYEIGWKHFLPEGQLNLSAFYKTRRNIIALRPEVFPTDNEWEQYLMTGNGHSYGGGIYFYKNWKKWMLQASYAYIRSWEWFDDFRHRQKVSSLSDIPHQLSIASSYKLSANSLLSLGANCRSGKILDLNDDFERVPAADFRQLRAPFTYRVDASYSYKKSFKSGTAQQKDLLLRVGIYNLIGNPPEEEIMDFYSVYLNKNFLPYGSLSFRF